jgi:hypothetical protein
VELFPQTARPHECAEFLFDRRVDCLIHVPSMVEVTVKAPSPVRQIEGVVTSGEHPSSSSYAPVMFVSEGFNETPETG